MLHSAITAAADMDAMYRYQRHIYLYRTKAGKPLTFSTQNNRMVPVRMLFKWLARRNLLLYNPASDLEMPKVEKRLPRDLLNPEEAELLTAFRLQSPGDATIDAGSDPNASA